MDYEERSEVIEVPKNTGIAGFLKVIESALRKPRVQSINIDARGKVTVRRFIVAGEPDPIGVDFESVTPYQIIRASTVTELDIEEMNASVSLVRAFERVSARRLYPVGVVMAPGSTFWKWLEVTSAYRPTSRDHLFGTPVALDAEVETSHLFLCAGFVRGGALIDTQESYKLQIPEVRSDS